jgi:hypothetical protein
MLLVFIANLTSEVDIPVFPRSFCSGFFVMWHIQLVKYAYSWTFGGRPGRLWFNKRRIDYHWRLCST